MPWKALTDGCLVGVVAPAGPAEPEHVAAVAPLLERFGLRTRLYPSCHARERFLAGPDAQRLADLHAAWADPAIDAVICLRGGYGSGRLLESIDPALMRAHDKPFVGYSDITALHALRMREGLVGLHGPMLASDLVRPGREADAQRLFQILRHGLVEGTCWAPNLEDERPRVTGQCEGRLIGGNLSLVAALAGTPWAWPAAGDILFLEDINEESYRVDRMLCQLRQCGLLDGVSGFLVGRFSQVDDPLALVAEHLMPLGKPLLAGWPTGHDTPHWPLPLGARVRLDAARGHLTLLQDVILPPSR